MSFEKALAFSLNWEGGAAITDDPDDPGGLTKWGISKRAHPDVDIRALTEDDAADIYLREYYLKAGCDQMAEPLDMVHFDACVNLGIRRADELLHKAINSGTSSPALVALQERDAYYVRLADQKPVMKKYLVGWLRRTADLRKAAGLP